VGQAGVQIGNSCWELYCKEHGLKMDGMLSEEVRNASNDKTDYMDTFFAEAGNGRFVPRAMMVDLEPSVIGEFPSSSCLD